MVRFFKYDFYMIFAMHKKTLYHNTLNIKLQNDKPCSYIHLKIKMSFIGV